MLRAKNASMEKKIILDKSFLQAESKTTPRLHALKNAGYKFIIIDTLYYEFATDIRKGQWGSFHSKLKPFCGNIEIWEHISDLVQSEITTQMPVSTLFCPMLTRGFENKLNGEPYEDGIIEQTNESIKKQREVDSYEGLIKLCNQIMEEVPNLKLIAGLPTDEEKEKSLNLHFNESWLTKFFVSATHGDRDATDLYIKAAECGLDDNWFIYHHQKVTLAMVRLFIKKYGMINTCGENFKATLIDSNYALCLNYADALATNETVGDLSYICNQLYGNKKFLISINDIDKLLPKEADIRLAAYYEWKSNETKNHSEISNWYAARAKLEKNTISQHFC